MQSIKAYQVYNDIYPLSAYLNICANPFLTQIHEEGGTSKKYKIRKMV